MKVKMKKIKYYIDHIKDEVCGAMEYAQKYIEYKSTHPQWAKMYSEMANAELNHAKYLHVIGAEHISSLSWVPEEDKEAWDKCTKRVTEKIVLIKLMLSQ